MCRAIFLMLVAVSVAGARPPYRKALAELLDLPAASPLNDCATCHLPGTDDDRPHNRFGMRLKAVRAELRKADITARLLAIANEDTDGDGVANSLELMAGTSPSDPKAVPDSRALNLAREGWAKRLASLSGYRWRPFEPVERPSVPVLHGFDSAMRGEARPLPASLPLTPSSPVDAFLEEKRRERGLKAMPEASRPVLLRRVTVDLTGLPPTPEEVEAFVNDPRPDAYERVVDRLLSSPAFAERWGRHWMDIWRYSDWAGFGAQIRDSQPHIWRWRDWILDALDADKPYSTMIREMLAADEVTPDDTDALRATGFLVRNYKLLSREKWLQDAVDHTAMAFLGVTLGCARCHDHMYDAITQKEYFQVRAIFAPHQVRIDRIPGEPSTARDGLSRVYDADPNVKTFLLIRGDDRTPGKDELAPGVPELFGGRFAVKPVTLPRAAYDPDGRDFVVAEDREAGQRALQKAEQNLRTARHVESLTPPRNKAVATKAVATATDALNKSKAAMTKPRKTYPTTSTGRRLAFADWIAARDNPLAARVAVNHVWARHFGTALVPGMFDFGKNAPSPTHPALVDWLAAEFMDSGWSLKRLHRLIVTSTAYRADSRPNETNMRQDPDNVYLWRFAPRRVEAEAVRDALLFVADTLDRQRGGPEVPYQQALTSSRRSIYVQNAQEKQAEFLLLFDCAAVTEAYQRRQAIMPSQALALLNSDAAVNAGRALVRPIAFKDDSGFVNAAFQRLLGRLPTTDETVECLAFLRSIRDPMRARENLAMVLINHHEFVTIR